MKRVAVLKKLRRAAKAAGVEYSEIELSNHLGVTVGTVRSTIGRHNEVAEGTVQAFYKQYEDVLGKGWWRT
jgi:hypothetical protein